MTEILDRELHALFAGGGEMGARMQAFDWTATPLGAPDSWPQSLKTCVRIMLTSRQPIWIGWGEELIYMYNDPYKSIIGGKHPDALGQPTATIWKEIWDIIGPMLSKAMRGVESTYVEAQRLIMERNGYEEETYYTFSYSPVPNDEGGVGGIICANTDDTSRVIGERQMALLQELAARSSDARTVDEACARGVAALETNPYDVPFALLYLTASDDRNVVRLAGSAGLDTNGDGPSKTVRLDDHTGNGARFADVLRALQPQVVENAVSLGVVGNGAWEQPPTHAVILPIAASGDTGRAGLLVVGLNPFRLFDDGYSGFLGLAARHLSAAIGNAEAYEEERRRVEALAELDRAKTAFFSNVSHEFRTPLTLLLGPAEDVLTDPEVREVNRERAATIHRNALRLLKLVNTLLDFSRIEAGRMQAVFEPTDLAALTAELASSFRSAIERAGLRLTVDAKPLSKPVYVDRDMWEKIVLNLLSNAFKHTFDGEISVRLVADSRHVILEVGDTGVGIPAEQVSHIFERFHRVPNAKSRTHEGTGIGLALVHELVKLHDGTIDVESTIDRGTLFRVTLPLGLRRGAAAGIVASARAAHPAGTAAYVEEALRWLPPGPAAERSDTIAHALTPADDSVEVIAGRVLVADDNADMRDYVTRLLREHGWTVEAVANGRAALEAAQARRPDVVVSDVMMPELDGFGLLRALREDPAMQSTPLILLSARAGEEARVEGMRAGADDYLVKPFAARELVARVATQLRRGQSLMESQRKQEMQQRLLVVVAQERERLRELFTQAPAAIAVLRGQDHVFEIANEHYLHLIGGRDIIGKPIREALPELAGQGVYELLDGVLRTGEAFVGDQYRVMVDSDGDGTPEEHYYNFVYQPIREPTGELERIFIHAIDVTEIVEAKRSAERAQVVAEDANRAKSEFLAAMSHELRTPLNAIAGYAQLLDLGIHGPVAPAQHDALERIRRSQQHLLALINDVLNFAKLEAGKVEYRIEDVPLAEVASEVMSMIEPQLTARGVAFEAEVSPDLVARADREKMRQVLLNLLSNAAKFTDRGGRVGIAGRKSADAADAMIYLEVSDTGIGIARDRLDEIFDPFVQVHRGLTRNTEGTGLGLSISRDLARGMGGDLRVDSEEGKGSTFTLSLKRSS